MNISFCTVVLSLIQGIALNTGVLPLAKGGALQRKKPTRRIPEARKAQHFDLE
jgi:hypothetical protein